jgi:hypothetical protein
LQHFVQVPGGSGHRCTRHGEIVRQDASSNFSMSDAALGQKRPLYQTKKFAISFAHLASSCPFVVEGRHEIGVREACVDKGGLFLTNQPESHRKSLPDFRTVEETADVLGIASSRGVTKSAFGTGVFGESDDEQA